MPEKPPNSLLKQKTALGNYLEDMLHQATQVALVPEVEGKVVEDELLPAELLTRVKVAEARVEPEVPELESEPEAEAKVEAEQTQALLEADFPMQCLMFKVGENLLSIPLIEMHSVVEWGDELTRLPHEPAWVLGILKHRDNNVRIIDSADILQIKRNSDQDPAHILVLGNERWGIVCDEIDKVVVLEYDDVQWNRQQSNQMTFGTIRSSLASLLNPQGIVEQLEKGRP